MHAGLLHNCRSVPSSLHNNAVAYDMQAWRRLHVHHVPGITHTPSPAATQPPRMQQGPRLNNTGQPGAPGQCSNPCTAARASWAAVSSSEPAASWALPSCTAQRVQQKHRSRRDNSVVVFQLFTQHSHSTACCRPWGSISRKPVAGGHWLHRLCMQPLLQLRHGTVDE